VDPNEHVDTPDEQLVLEDAFNPEWLRDDDLDPLLEDEPYEPGFFARLTARRPLVILLVIAFLLLILAPSLYYLLNPPHPRPPRQVPGRVITVLNEKGPLHRPLVWDCKRERTITAWLPPRASRRHHA